MELNWQKTSDDTWVAGVAIGGDIARRWLIHKGPDKRYRASFGWLRDLVFIGAATVSLREQQKRVGKAAEVLGHSLWP
jgi:hypothetical protein